MSIDSNSTNVYSSLSSSFHYGIDEASTLAHSFTDRIDRLQTAIVSELSDAKNAKDYYPLAKFGGKVLLIPASIAKSSLFEHALYVDGAKRINDIVTHSSGNSTTVDEITSGLTKSGGIVLQHALGSMQGTVEGAISEIIDTDKLSTNEKIYGGAALATTGALLIPYAVKSAKNIFMGAEVALLAYEVYQNHEEALEHPVTKAVVENSQSFLDNAQAGLSSLYDQGVETWNGLSTEGKTATGVAAAAAGALTGYGVVTIAPTALSAASAVARPALTAGKWALRGLLALETAEMLFGTNEAKQEKKA